MASEQHQYQSYMHDAQTAFDTLKADLSDKKQTTEHLLRDVTALEEKTAQLQQALQHERDVNSDAKLKLQAAEARGIMLEEEVSEKESRLKAAENDLRNLAARVSLLVCASVSASASASACVREIGAP